MKKVEVSKRYLNGLAFVMWTTTFLSTGIFSYSLYLARGLWAALVPWGMLFGIIAAVSMIALSNMEAKKEEPLEL